MTSALDTFLASKGLALHPLSDDHMVEWFDCGRDERMTGWFTSKARQWHAEDMCRVWVLVKCESPGMPVGFFTLSSHQILPSNVEKNARSTDPSNRGWVNALHEPYPAQLLGKFALASDAQGQGLGEVLMLCVYSKYLEAADVTGAKFLVLDAQEPGLVTYYDARFGFAHATQQDGRTKMYRPTSAIRQDCAAVFTSEA